jgi:hypothetical protein
MRYLGRFQLGQFVHLAVTTTNTAEEYPDAPTAPSAAPVFSIYNNGGGKVITNKRMPLQHPAVATMFAVDQMLACLSALGPAYGTVEFEEGRRYFVRYEWVISAANFARIDCFDVIPGGDCRGAYTALEFYERPQADFVVGALENGTVEKRRGPSIP